MKIVSWNVNGLRTLDREKSSLRDTFDAFNADIIAVQETKISDNDPRLGLLARLPGYDAFFSFCRTRDGYSGVATYCRQSSDVCVTPVDAGEGFTNSVGGSQVSFFDTDGLTSKLLSQMQQEGRCVITDHEVFVLINVYVPAVTVEDRALFKLKFCLALQRKVEALQKAGRHVCVVGDLNIAHRKIDMAKKLAMDIDISSPTRLWLNRMLTNGGMIDTFRHYNPKKEDSFTCWSTLTNARETNYGVRIDYVLASKDFVLEEGLSSEVLQHVYGSDHCPVTASFKNSSFKFKGRREPPSFCAKYLPHLASRQTSIKQFLGKRRSKSTNGLGTRALLFSRSKPSPASTKPGGDRSNSRKKAKSQLSITNFFGPLTPQKRNSGNVLNEKKDRESCEPQQALKAACIDSAESRAKRSERWKNILKGPPETPWCKIHKERCITKVVTKKSPNHGRKFFSCSRPECSTFYWYSDIVDQRKRQEKSKQQAIA